ncbi:MAG: folate-binding protein [Methylococcales bacterium]|nr:folate-binding protein [Methylococcales bacterium]
MTEQITRLPNLAILQVTGQDAANFLQGQVTCDVRLVTTDNASLGALCNPKGRVISNFIIGKVAAGFVLLLPVALADLVLQRLQRYILRADVNIERPAGLVCLGCLVPAAQPKPDHHEGALWPWASLPAVSGYQRWLSVVPEQTSPPEDTRWLAAWHYHDIRWGWLWLSEATSESFIPQTLRLDTLGAVAFDKGCYTGQEIVARTHYLGKAKRMLCCATVGQTHAVAINAAVVDHAQQTVGQVLDNVEFDGQRYLTVLLSAEHPAEAYLFTEAPDASLLHLETYP